tara:strand:- start:80 stop:736 length:657 start_codon:yes stop_codon:yes gene_type:complete
MSELNQRILTSLFLLLIILLSFLNQYMLYLLLFLLNLNSLDEFFNLFKEIYKNKNKKIFLALMLAIFYMIYFTSSIIYFLNGPIQNNYALFFILLICVSTDIGGFVVGKILGGKKLTSISPNKTISGLIGSFIFALIFGFIYYKLQNDTFNINLNIFLYIILISLLSQIGDLTISYLKRKAKFKDTGNILPGHGGILDRIDGILLALPFSIILIIVTS